MRETAQSQTSFFFNRESIPMALNNSNLPTGNNDNNNNTIIESPIIMYGLNCIAFTDFIYSQIES